MGTRKAAWKNTIFECIFDVKMGGLECREPSWRLILVTIYEVSVFHEKASKIEGKGIPK